MARAQNSKLFSLTLMFLILLCARPIVASKMKTNDASKVEVNDFSKIGKMIANDPLYKPMKLKDLSTVKKFTAKQYFDTIYKSIPEAFHGSTLTDDGKKQRDAVYKTGGSPIYGEMLWSGIEKLILEDFKATSSDVFMDLGSGSGKAPIQFTLLTGGQSIGLEFVPFRHELALRAHSKLPSEYKTSVSFIQADMFNYPIPSATIYMIDGCMFRNKYPDIVKFLLEYGPSNFRVWNIGGELPFPIENIKKIVSKKYPSTWSKNTSTTLYWIEK